MTDLELNTRIAEFVGWTELRTEEKEILRGSYFCSEERLVGTPPSGKDSLHGWEAFGVPDYANNLNAWVSDCFPKIHENNLEHKWANALQLLVGTIPAFITNASSRQRCIALVKVLDERSGP